MIVLYGRPGSPFVARIVMQAHAKELLLELRPPALGTEEFRRMNPLGKMPLLDHDGFFLPESTVIAEYLEEEYPTPSLLGETAQDRAWVRLITRTVDLYCDGMLSLLHAAADPTQNIDTDKKRAGLAKGLNAIETFLSDDGYAVAGELSLADCALVPWLYYGRMWAELDPDMLGTRPKLARYVEFVAGQSLIQRVWDEMDIAFKAFMAQWQAEQALKAGPA